MNLPVIGVIGDVFKGVIGIVDQLVEDKDKKLDATIKIMELQNALAINLMSQKTTPWVDATVKLLFAVRDVVIPLFRPIVSAMLTGYAAYAAANGITMNPMVEAALASAFPGWMAARWSEKKGGK
jgi:hypothetical protein